MTVDDDLASWGEPPADPTEMAWADFLDEVLAELERGNAASPATLGTLRPGLTERGESLARNAT